MQILFLDFLHWVFPKNHSVFKDFLKSKNVECIDAQPCEISHYSRMLINPVLLERKPASFYRGFNIDEFIKVELAMETGWYKPSLRTILKYRQWAMYLIDWAFETFEKVKPDYIVIEGGLTYLSRTMVEVARELGIKVIAVENSFIKDKIFIDFDTGVICNRHLFARTSQDWIQTRYLTKSQNKEADQIIKTVFQNLNYQTTGTFDKSQLKYEKTVVVPLQVFADQVTLYDSKFNNEQFLNKILDLAKNEFNDWNIILRCHPKEERNRPKATGDWLENQNLPNNVTLIRGSNNSINTQELLKFADLVMVNTSQAGLEACLLGKPVIVFGDAFYANKGFTLEYNNDLNWDKVKDNPDFINNFKETKKWFYFFSKWLYNKSLTELDKQRIAKELNLR